MLRSLSEVPVSGILYSPDFFYVDGQPAEPQPRICGMDIWYGKVVSKGRYVVGGAVHLYFLDPTTCISYRVMTTVWSVVNVTGKAYIFTFYMPTAEKRYYAVREGHEVVGFNGTAHAYYVPLYPVEYVATGLYLANSTWLHAAVLASVRYPFAGLTHGPVHYSAYSNDTDAHAYAVMLTIGPEPGDGVIPVKFPDLAGKVEVAYVAEGSKGYVELRRVPIGVLFVYAKRYALAEVAIANGTYVYAMRLPACPAYRGQSDLIMSPYVPARLDRAREAEICNNSTASYYVGVYSTAPYSGYTWIDYIGPGACRRVRWDAASVQYRFFNSTYALCRECASSSPWTALCVPRDGGAF